MVLCLHPRGAPHRTMKDTMKSRVCSTSSCLSSVLDALDMEGRDQCVEQVESAQARDGRRAWRSGGESVLDALFLNLRQARGSVPLQDLPSMSVPPLLPCAFIPPSESPYSTIRVTFIPPSESPLFHHPSHRLFVGGYADSDVRPRLG